MLDWIARAGGLALIAYLSGWLVFGIAVELVFVPVAPIVLRR